MRYQVIAKQWSEEKKAIVEYIAGSFNEYHLAAIFRDAYNDHYRADAKIVDIFNN